MERTLALRNHALQVHLCGPPAPGSCRPIRVIILFNSKTRIQPTYLPSGFNAMNHDSCTTRHSIRGGVNPSEWGTHLLLAGGNVDRCDAGEKVI
jgi:hypothetical protein